MDNEFIATVAAEVDVGVMLGARVADGKKVGEIATVLVVVGNKVGVMVAVEVAVFVAVGISVGAFVFVGNKVWVGATVTTTISCKPMVVLGKGCDETTPLGVKGVANGSVIWPPAAVMFFNPATKTEKTKTMATNSFTASMPNTEK